ncbi:hypothetical protein FSP39_016166 [Pinctada imbricata]|uniref:H-type lectin domain-containing protein n=1 Tax=Pinctada imbricata TaxID=66713 RepID=A0AA89C415_PINIB|nr:hypothetical protein FSP39_016166 [Pinctada imbricata]
MQAGDAYSSWAPGLTLISGVRFFSYGGGVSGYLFKKSHPDPPSWPVTAYIKFDPPFEKTPAITTGMTLLDTDKSTNTRATINTNNITRHGFELILTKTFVTLQWGLRASWMACPAR